MGREYIQDKVKTFAKNICTLQELKEMVDLFCERLDETSWISFMPIETRETLQFHLTKSKLSVIF